MHRTHTFTHCTALEYILLLSCLLDPENTHTGPPFWTPAIIFPWRLMNEPGRTRAGSGSKRPLVSAHKSGTESFSFRPHKNEPLSTNEPLWWFQVDPNGAGGELRRVWFKSCYRLWCWLLRVPQLVLEVLSRITPPPPHTHTPPVIWQRAGTLAAWMHYSSPGLTQSVFCFHWNCSPRREK